MGRARTRKEAFLKDNPTCCFCGHRSADTQDHIPSRDFFISRSWPENYVFPACEACNTGTANLESVVAFYLTAINFDESQFSSDDTDRRIRALLNNAPKVFPKGVFSSSKRRKVMRSLGIRPKLGQTSEDFPAMQVDKSLHIAFHAFSSKLLCALYYKHLGQIAPNDAYFFGWWGQYISHDAQCFVQEVSGSLDYEVVPKRSNNDFYNQFKYKYSANEGTGFFAMTAQFRKSFFIIGAISKFDDVPEEPWLQCAALPFR